MNFLSKKKIDIIIPAFNESVNLLNLYHEIVQVWDKVKDRYDYQIFVIDDGSTDDTIEVISRLNSQDKKVGYIELSRNFGKEVATSAGIHNSTGDAVIVIDADLQHPPELIPELIDRWEQGADLVIGIRDHNCQEGYLKRIGSYWYYKIMHRIGETGIIPYATDFRLIDRRVVHEFNRFTEHNRMTRGLLEWLGFHKDFVHFCARQRPDGKARYGLLKLTKLALSSFVAHSLFPLKFAGYLGIVITLGAGSFGLYAFVHKYLLKDAWGRSITGSAGLAVIIIFMIGIVLSCLGLIALYIANIHNEVVNRPLYVVRSRKV